MIKKLADHYFPGPQHAEGHQQLLVEWQKAKYDLLQWKENDLPQAIRQGEGSITATDWCLSKLMQPPYRSHYPMLPFITEVCLSCPVSNTWPGRGDSILKWQKNRLQSRIKNDLLNPLLHVSINGPKQQSKELPSSIHDVIAEWLKEKDRRKLKKLPPISATVASIFLAKYSRSTRPSTTTWWSHFTWSGFAILHGSWWFTKHQQWTKCRPICCCSPAWMRWEKPQYGRFWLWIRLFLWLVIKYQV